jgi:hypothetical protein
MSRNSFEEIPRAHYIVWAVAIVVCFYLGARLTFQVRERKKSQLKIDSNRQRNGRRTAVSSRPAAHAGKRRLRDDRGAFVRALRGKETGA